MERNPLGDLFNISQKQQDQLASEIEKAMFNLFFGPALNKSNPTQISQLQFMDSLLGPDKDQYLKYLEDPKAHLQTENERPKINVPKPTRKENLPKNKEKEIENHPKIEVTQISNEFKKDLVGEGITILAVKNEYSYMMGTQARGYKLIENDYQVYHTDNFPKGYLYRLKDIAYVKKLNCYLVSLGCKIYRKDINESPLYPFMDILYFGKPGAFFRYSRIHGKNDNH